MSGYILFGYITVNNLKIDFTIDHEFSSHIEQWNFH